MEPSAALASVDKPTRTDATAPAAAHWLANPTETKPRLTQAQLWGDEPQWPGPFPAEEQ